MAHAPQPLFVPLRHGVQSQHFSPDGCRDEGSSLKKMVVTLRDGVWEGKGQGLFFLTILFFPITLGFFSESHIYNIDGSQRQWTSKGVQETRL